RRSPGRRRITLPRSPPPRATKAREGRVGNLGAQTARSRLQAHAPRTSSTRRPTLTLGTVLRTRRRTVCGPTARRRHGGDMSAWWKPRRARASELEQEMRSHVDMDVADRVARGESADQAKRNAHMVFGNMTSVRETTTDMWSGELLHQVSQDIRYAI